MGQDTLTLLRRAVWVGNNILDVISRFLHSRSICDKLSNKMLDAQEFLKGLCEKYEINKELLEQKSFTSSFNNYVTVVEICLGFLEAFENKALFMRLINRDKYKRTFYKIFSDIDQAVSVLLIGMSVKTHLNSSVSQDPVNLEKLDFQNRKLALIASSISGFDDVLADSQQRDVIIEEIRNVQENRTSTTDILASVEIPRRQVKSIPGLLPKTGRRYVVHKRMYQSKTVAEKILYGSLCDENVLSDVRKQVAILKRLAVCPYIVQFIGVCIKGNTLGFITDYAEKGSLKNLLESTDRIDKYTKYKFTVDVVEGVAFLHEMGVLHKNLKTSSILITEGDKAKISGFEFSREIGSGTAIVFDDESDRYRWIPPEKILDYFESTNKSDVYSLGMVIWSIWSRRYPYEIKSQQNIEESVGRGLREDVTLVPEEIRPIISKCWKKDPEERPNATDILNDLDFISNQTGESEFVPKNMQNLWSLENIAKEALEYDVGLKASTSIKSAKDFKSSIVTNGQKSGEMNKQRYMPVPISCLVAPSKIETSYLEIPPQAQIEDMGFKDEKSLRQDSLDDFDEFDQAFAENYIGGTMLDWGFEELDLPPKEPFIKMTDAIHLHNNHKRKEAFESFQEHASFNEDPKAHYYLGYYYYWGIEGVVDRDWYSALIHFEVASKNGDSDALFHLGVHYANEENRERDLVKAFEYYKKSAELGNSKGYYHLGICYAKGQGTLVNKFIAIKHLQQAANQGHSRAKDILNHNYRK